MGRRGAVTPLAATAGVRVRTARRGALGAAALAGLGLACSACGRERYVGDATEVLVVVATDLVPVGADGVGELDAVRVVVAGTCDALDRGGQVRSFAVGPGGTALPFSFGIAPARGALSWCARIEAQRASRSVIQVVRSGSFREGQTVSVGAFLSRACIDVATGRPRSCGDGETCGAGGRCVPQGLPPDATAFDPTLCQPGDVVTCVTAAGGLGRGTCGDDGSPPLGPRCASLREIPGNGRDDDGRDDTPDDGACSAAHAAGSHRRRDPGWTRGLCATYDTLPPWGVPRWSDEVCLGGGRVRIGDDDGFSPFADPTSASLTNAEPSRVPLDESPAHDVVIPAFWADVAEVSFCRFLDFWSSVDDDADRPLPRLEAAGSPRCAGGCLAAERCYVRSEQEAFCVGEPIPLQSPPNGCVWTPQDPRGIVGGADEGSVPINCVPWSTALAFCEWDGAREGRIGRLPTEAEWERMARGIGPEPRLFPWGDEPPSCQRAFARALRPGQVMRARCEPDDGTYCGCSNQQDAQTPTDFDGAGLPALGPAPIDRLALLGLYQPGPEGLFGLAGNVAEWTMDAYRRDTYAERCGSDGRACDGEGAPVAPVVTPLALRFGSRVVRGGSWRDPPGSLRVSARQELRAQPERDPENPDRYDLLRASVYNGIGFRCVREP